METNLIAMYLALGASQSSAWTGVHKLCDQLGLNGHLGFMEHIGAYIAPLVAAFNASEDHPGVFLYEVVEPFGTECMTILERLADQPEAAHQACLAALNKRVNRFYSQVTG